MLAQKSKFLTVAARMAGMGSWRLPFLRAHCERTRRFPIIRAYLDSVTKPEQLPVRNP